MRIQASGFLYLMGAVFCHSMSAILRKSLRDILLLISRHHVYMGKHQIKAEFRRARHVEI
jgi:hypothetical protein